MTNTAMSKPAWPAAEGAVPIDHGTVLGLGLLGTVEMWLSRRRQRIALGELAERNDYLLRDTGIAREDAMREAEKAFWAR